MLAPDYKISEQESNEASTLYWLEYHKFESLTAEQREAFLLLVDAQAVFHRVNRWPVTVQEVLDYYEARFR
jgi:hypothetical protein